MGDEERVFEVSITVKIGATDDGNAYNILQAVETGINRELTSQGLGEVVELDDSVILCPVCEMPLGIDDDACIATCPDCKEER